MLGETIEEIAWHKAGIMKAGVPVFTTEQVPAAQAVLEERAAEKGVSLEVVKPFKLGTDGKPEVNLALEGDFQLYNASLAVAAAASHLQNIGIAEGFLDLQTLPAPAEHLPEQFMRGLESAKIQGRCEVRKTGNIEWLIDGAHTIDSMGAVARWFVKRLTAALQDENPPTATMLIFNQQDRDTEPLIRSLVNGVKDFHSFQITANPATGAVNLGSKSFIQHASKVFTYAAFCTNTPFKNEVAEGVDLERQERNAEVYSRLDGNAMHMCYGSVEEAVELARKISEGDERVLVLVTGSLYLVGGLLQVLGRQVK
jgi:folylpolyglutamate synthase